MKRQGINPLVASPVQALPATTPTPTPSADPPLRVGVIGYGYWGPNVVRNLTSVEGSELMAVCDKSPAARRRLQRAHPGISVATEASEILIPSLRSSL